MSAPQALPWHQQQWAVIGKALQGQRLPHALLLHGPRGLGKSDFMQRLAGVLVCANPGLDPESGRPDACGTCRPCTQYSEEGAHADIFLLQPEEEGKQIKVDSARDAIKFSGLASHYGGRKLLLIEPAEALNLSAANALLKTLEEPSAATTLVLLSHQPSRLLPTIRSRCLQIRFTKPARQQTLAWLREQGIEDAENLTLESQGYPYTALAMSRAGTHEWRQQRDQELSLFLSDNRSAAGLARIWAAYDVKDIHAWLHDRVRRCNWALQGESAAQGIADHTNAALQELIKRPELRKIDAISTQIDQLLKSELNNINKQLLLESVLISMSGDNAEARAS